MGYLDKLKAAASLAKAAIEESQALTAASDPTANVALHGAAGRVSYGFDKTSDVPDRIEDSGSGRTYDALIMAPVMPGRADYLSQSRSPLSITRVVTQVKRKRRT